MVSLSKPTETGGHGCVPRFSAPASFARSKSYQVYLRLSMVLILLLGFVSNEQVNAAVTKLYSTEEGRNCVCNYDAEEDYFPIKVQPNYATGFSVEYFKHYKVITSGEHKYYAYQCGTPEPEVPEGAVSVMIPLRNVGVGSTTFLPFLDYIRQGPTVAFALSEASALPSACHKKRALIGKLGTISGWGSLESAHLEDHKLDSVFLDAWGHGGGVKLIQDNCATAVPILVGSDSEKTPLATAEWVEFVAAFFNREEAAADVVENIELRYTCTKELVAQETTGLEKPKVLWFSYYAGTWYIGHCPNYYCNFIEDAGGAVVEFKDATVVDPEKLSFQGLNHTEALSLPLSEVDVVIYNGDYEVLSGLNDTDVQNILGQFKQDARIFSTSKHTTSAWFSSRPAEPDVAFLDIVTAVQPQLESQLNHTRFYLRQHAENLVDNIVKSDPADCPDESAPLFTNWKKSGCAGEKAVIPGLEIPQPTCPLPNDVDVVGCGSGSTNGPTSDSVASSTGVAAIVALAFCIAMMLIA